MKLRTLALVCAWACLTVGCGAAGGGSQSVGGVIMVDYQGMLREYHGLADHYPWPLPDRTAFPDTLPPPQEETLYEVGEGRNQADSFWICSWMGDWIRAQAHHDADEKLAAWSWVERADETQLHQEHYDDPTDIWHRQILAPAQAGDPRPVREFYATSCGFPGLATLPDLLHGQTRNG